MGLRFDQKFGLQRWSDGKIRDSYQNFPDGFDEDGQMNRAGRCAYVTRTGEWEAANCTELRPVVCEGLSGELGSLFVGIV